MVAGSLEDYYPGEWDSVRALVRLRDAGCEDQIPQLAERMREACLPCQHDRLVKRLTALGMTMAPNRPVPEATVWVHELARLLADLPEDVVYQAIDDHQRESRFLPTVAEIRERADPIMDHRRRQVARLDAMARYLRSGQTIPRLKPPEPPKKPGDPMTAAEIAETNARLERLGATTRYREDGTRYQVEPKARGVARELRKPTRQDYIEMGVDPAYFEGKS